MSLYDSLSPEDKTIYEAHYKLARDLIQALQNYQISPNIIKENPQEVVDNFFEQKEREAKKELGDEVH